MPLHRPTSDDDAMDEIEDVIIRRAIERKSFPSLSNDNKNVLLQVNTLAYVSQNLPAFKSVEMAEQVSTLITIDPHGDVRLILDDGTFKASRKALCLSSPVFLAMLGDDSRF